MLPAEAERRLKRRLRALGVFGTILGLGLASCKSEPRERRPLARIRVAEHPRSSLAPLFIAADAGYFAAEGIDIDFKPVDVGSPASLAALINGDLDVDSVGPASAFLNAIARGAAIRVVAGEGVIDSDRCVQFAWVVRSDWLDAKGHLDSRKLKGARSRWDPLRSTTFLTERALATEGLSTADLRRAPVSSLLAEQALEHGDLDFAFLPAVPLVRALASRRIAVWKTLPQVVPRWQLFALAFAPRLLGKDRDLGVRFLTAYLRGVRAFNRGLTPRFQDILSKHFEMTRPEVESCCWPTFPDEARIEIANWLDYQSWAAPQKALDRVLPAGDFADTSLLAEAGRRLSLHGGV